MPKAIGPQAAEERFQKRIIEWSEAHPRWFPWREQTDPFAVLIAEVMLRRTRAEQVAPVFERFMQRFPNALSLTRASELEVEPIVRPLGLAWRTPTFRLLAEALLARHGGQVPPDYEELRRLPGVGDYVAAAVSIFAFNLPLVPVDTNTVRVAGRYFGFPYHAESRRNRDVRKQVARLVDFSRPGDSARALLDFAAVTCRAGHPRHEECPVARFCLYASQTGSPGLIA